MFIICSLLIMLIRALTSAPAWGALSPNKVSVKQKEQLKAGEEEYRRISTRRAVK